jgi:hypothetical protein
MDWRGVKAQRAGDCLAASMVAGLPAVGFSPDPHLAPVAAALAQVGSWAPALVVLATEAAGYLPSLPWAGSPARLQPGSAAIPVARAASRAEPEKWHCTRHIGLALLPQAPWPDLPDRW